jgi:hypothetical protein
LETPYFTSGSNPSSDQAGSDIGAFAGNKEAFWRQRWHRQKPSECANASTYASSHTGSDAEGPDIGSDASTHDAGSNPSSDLAGSDIGAEAGNKETFWRQRWHRQKPSNLQGR